ncbi:MAG: LacI family DNA-binding transcriptional regulator [Candidatus Goldiibacteriota bacterium]
MGRVTIKDIARAAGVTHATVSYAINTPHKVKKETREKILKLLEEMNYIPDSAARMLKMGKTRTIGVVVGSIGTIYTNEVMKGLEQAMADTVYDIKIYPTSAVHERREKIFDKMFMMRREDAMIINGWDWMNHREKLERMGIPIVLLEYEVEGRSSVAFDNFKSGYEAASYMIKKGAKNPAIVVGDTDFVYSQKQRYLGFKKALEENSLSFDRDLAVRVHNHEYDEGVGALNCLLDSGKYFDAVFCAAGDLVAAGIMREALAKGQVIPGDFSLMGHDETDYAEMFNLTTVKQPLAQMAKQAFKFAVEEAEGVIERKKKVEFQPEIIERKTV